MHCRFPVPLLPLVHFQTHNGRSRCPSPSFLRRVQAHNFLVMPMLPTSPSPSFFQMSSAFASVGSAQVPLHRSVPLPRVFVRKEVSQESPGRHTTQARMSREMDLERTCFHDTIVLGLVRAICSDAIVLKHLQRPLQPHSPPRFAIQQSRDDPGTMTLWCSRDHFYLAVGEIRNSFTPFSLSYTRADGYLVNIQRPSLKLLIPPCAENVMYRPFPSSLRNTAVPVLRRNNALWLTSSEATPE